jgi:hypothetical protein
MPTDQVIEPTPFVAHRHTGRDRPRARLSLDRCADAAVLLADELARLEARPSLRSMLQQADPSEMVEIWFLADLDEAPIA